MTATTTIIVDGQVYHKGDEIPELGTIECYANEGNLRHYNLMSADVSKLPKYDSLGAGSDAFCIDTSDLYIYHKGTKTWVKL